MTSVSARAIFALWLLNILSFSVTCGALADEVRPAYLGLVESSKDSFDVVWKVPAKSNAARDILPAFPEPCELAMQPFVETTGGLQIFQGKLTCGHEGLREGQIEIPGLTGSLIDTLVHVAWLDGETNRYVLKSGAAVSLAKQEPPLVNDYIVLGFEHILGGTDHLLFVLALLLIVAGKRSIFITVTAFTVGHSITLALATLGLITLSQAPVEAMIALSIVFLAVEAIHLQQGHQSLATRAPWVVAILFGLLHGLGFAGALKDVGLPQDDVPLALLFFNLGIEFGQLVFVFVVLGVLFTASWRIKVMAPRVMKSDFRRLALVSAYVIGIVAMSWVLDRTVQILT